MRYQHNNGTPGTVIGLVLTFVLVVPVLFLLGVNTTRATLGRYEITGTVVGEVTGKVAFTASQQGSSGAMKFAVPLDTDGDGGLDRVVNCSSTQCAALTPDVLVTFSCYEEWHVFEPNEEECRFEDIGG